jgi:DNA polymerase phi
MMKKRKSPAMPGDDNDDDEDSEMVDVIGEEKMETAGNDDSEMEDDLEADGLDEARDTVEDSSFMDTFYGLSSSNPMERAQAANSLLHHCLIGPHANIKDAAYALRRLLNGLCSGRAASRQGNASALSSFLRLSLEGGQLNEIKSQDDGDETNADKAVLVYVRDRLLKATDPSSSVGKKKGSEERDYQFGRLFGVLSVARSGILLPQDGSAIDIIMQVSSGFVTDLVELYHDKKWMREPAAHAIVTMLRMFYADSSGTSVAAHLVEEVVIPTFLVSDGSFDITNLEAEKIAVVTAIQSHIADHPNRRLPAPLDQPIITTETMAIITTVLVETSSVALPRTHLVWDSIWLYLTKPTSTQAPPAGRKTGPSPVTRELRKVTLVGSDSPRDIIDVLIQKLILERLLRVDNEGGTKATHEKRALALCLVRNLLGVPFNSSITGPTQILLEAPYLESILKPVLIRRLFLDVIFAGGGSSKKAHTLKPLALQILASMVNATTQHSSEAAMNRRLRLATAFVQCEPRLDSLTKTTTIADLVGLGEGEANDVGASRMTAVNSYIDFLEVQILSSCRSEGDLMLGYIDTLYQSSKRLLRLASADETESSDVGQIAMKTVEGVLGFFMASSFFDCQSFSCKTGHKGKKGKSRKSEKTHVIVEVAAHISEARKKNKAEAPLSFASRSMLSERFYSLLAEYVISSMHSGRGSSAKDSTLLGIVEGMCAGWKALETGGAKPFFSRIDNTDDDEGDSQSPAAIVSQLQSLASDNVSAAEKDPDNTTLRAKKRCATGCAALASTLFLHLLGCGRPEVIMDEDEVTTEDDDDSADILDAIEAIGEVTPLLLEKVEEADENPLATFAEVCVAVLSTNVSSGNPGRGASPRLLREAVKFAWMGALSVSAASSRNLLDAHAVSVLLGGIGADQNQNQDGGEDAERMEEEYDDDTNETDEDRGDEENSDHERSDFSKVGKILFDEGEKDNADNDSDEKGADSHETDDAEDEEEINQEKLNSLLEDDSDAGIDAGELEHHEGADAALAKLIKLQQEARKAGQRARERLELEKQLRCTLLLETILGKSESWASLLRSDVVLQMVLPMLAYRNQMEKSLSKSAGEANDSSVKKALLDRLSSLLKSKLFKLKLSAMQTSESVDITELCSSLAASLLDMTRGSNSKDQRACCSAGLAMVVKATPNADDMVKVASIYAKAVDEWSTKKTSRLEASLFDELISHSPR